MLLDKRSDDPLAPMDRIKVKQREGEPSPQETPSHSRLCLIQDVKEALPLLSVHRIEDLQTTEGEAIEAHVVEAVNASERGDMPQLMMTR